MHDHIQSEWWRFEACTIENNALRPAPELYVTPTTPGSASMMSKANTAPSQPSGVSSPSWSAMFEPTP